MGAGGLAFKEDITFTTSGHVANARKVDNTVNIDDVRQMTFDAVLDHGHGIVLSPPTLRVEVPYAYTAGRTMKGRPELIMTGVEHEAEAAILNEVCLFDDLIGIEPDTLVPVAGITVKITESDPANLVAALMGFGRVEAYQVLLPDARGEYPDSVRGRTPAQPHLPLIPADSWDPYDEYEDE